MTTPYETGQFCSVLSEQVAEPLAGTALQAETYLLLEYHGPLGKEALAESDLPFEVKSFFTAQLKILPSARLLLVRGPNRPFEAGPLFFLVRTIDSNPVIYRFQLDQVSDVLALNLESIQKGDSSWDPYILNEHLFLVCTHGRRDPCCAKFGLPVYHQLRERLGNSIWQSSHVGGHRFATNLLILPHGLMYGRLGTRSAEEIVSAYQRGEMELDHLRGRTAYPQPVQAAEVLLRWQTGQVGLKSFCLISHEETAPGLWRIVFQQNEPQKRFNLVVGAERTSQGIFESCQSDKQTPLTHYYLDHFELMA